MISFGQCTRTFQANVPVWKDHLTQRLKSIWKRPTRLTLNPLQKKTNVIDTGCKGSFALKKLTDHDRYLNTPTDPMHTLKNIAERIVKLAYHWH